MKFKGQFVMTSSLIAMPPNNLLIQPVIVAGDETLSHNKKWTKYKSFVDTNKMFFLFTY